MTRTDWAWQELGLRADANPDQLRAAYRDLVQVWHPDRFAHDPRLRRKAEEKLKNINRAYEMLTRSVDNERSSDASATGTTTATHGFSRSAKSRADAASSKEHQQGSRWSGRTSGHQVAHDETNERPSQSPWRRLRRPDIAIPIAIVVLALFARVAGNRTAVNVRIEREHETVTMQRLTRDLLRNGAYSLPDTMRSPFRLVEGTYQSDAGDSVWMGDSIGYGDVNADGHEDAVVTIVANTGGSGSFVHVVVLFNTRGTYRQGPHLLLGDRVIITGLHVQSNNIMVDLMDHAPGDGLCCPSQAKTIRLVVRGSQIVGREAGG
jgi:hypothetical protein